jgi:hypothetical protein
VEVGLGTAVIQALQVSQGGGALEKANYSRGVHGEITLSTITLQGSKLAANALHVRVGLAETKPGMGA